MSYVVKSAVPLVVIHIPKCAGQSVRKWFSYNFEIEDIPNDRTKVNFHSTIDDARAYLSGMDGYRSMAVVRNPWKRAFSWFLFRKQHLTQTIADLYALGDHDNINMGKDLDSIAEEYRWASAGFNQWLDRYVHQPWDNTWFSLAMPQTTWLGDHELDLVVDCDTNIARQVHKKLKDVMVTASTYSMPRRNVSNSRPELYREIYNDHGRKLIAQLHRTDIDRFGYGFK